MALMMVVVRLCVVVLDGQHGSCEICVRSTDLKDFKVTSHEQRQSDPFLSVTLFSVPSQEATAAVSAGGAWPTGGAESRGAEGQREAAGGGTESSTVQLPQQRL